MAQSPAGSPGQAGFEERFSGRAGRAGRAWGLALPLHSSSLSLSLSFIRLRTTPAPAHLTSAGPTPRRPGRAQPARHRTDSDRDGHRRAAVRAAAIKAAVDERRLGAQADPGLARRLRRLGCNP